MPVYCISGANRGLGLEFVRQLSQSPENTILALTRSLSSDLSNLKSLSTSSSGAKIHILECDTSSLPSIHTFAKTASTVLAPNGLKIDYLLNNAGVNIASSQSSLTLNPDDLFANVRVNVLGPAKVTEFLVNQGLLSRDVRILNMTSGLGSLSLSSTIKPRKAMGYSVSKAGLNMLTVHQAEDLRTPEEKGGPGLVGAVVVCMDPGWVKTRMGGSGAVLEAEESISGMLKVLHGLGEGDNGKFFKYDGDELGW